MRKSGHLHGRPFLGLEELTSQLTQAFARFSRAGPPALRVQSAAGMRAEPSLAASLSLPSEHLHGFPIPRLAHSGGSLGQSIFPWETRGALGSTRFHGDSRWCPQGPEHSRQPRAACGDVTQEPQTQAYCPYSPGSRLRVSFRDSKSRRVGAGVGVPPKERSGTARSTSPRRQAARALGTGVSARVRRWRALGKEAGSLCGGSEELDERGGRWG